MVSMYEEGMKPHEICKAFEAGSVPGLAPRRLPKNSLSDILKRHKAKQIAEEQGITAKNKDDAIDAIEVRIVKLAQSQVKQLEVIALTRILMPKEANALTQNLKTLQLAKSIREPTTRQGKAGRARGAQPQQPDLIGQIMAREKANGADPAPEDLEALEHVEGEGTSEDQAAGERSEQPVEENSSEGERAGTP